MSNRTATTNHEFQRLIREARMQRSAAMAQLLVDGVVFVGTALKRVFGFVKPRTAPASASRKFNLS